MTRDISRRRTAKLDALAPILVIVGMKREAGCAAGEGVTTLCSGADVARLRRQLDALEGTDFSAVVSFGLAGGLDHALRPGHVVVADAVVSGESRRDTHSRLSSALMKGAGAAGCSVSQGAIIGVDEPAMHPAAKAALRESAQAVAVDMESHLAEEFARRRNVPFVAIRAISDPAARALPPLVARALTPEGDIHTWGVARELIRRPGQLGGMIRAGLDSRAAFGSLGRCGPLLGPLLRLMLAEL
ncbi:MAG: phosphorylase [Alphaproteobacteria bacterium]|nr:phosphorylase [Alphaproteobacteria bacterium]MBM3652933.1 phosphorylase [Alphaproteobacteria bacterium]